MLSIRRCGVAEKTSVPFATMVEGGTICSLGWIIGGMISEHFCVRNFFDLRKPRGWRGFSFLVCRRIKARGPAGRRTYAQAGLPNPGMEPTRGRTRLMPDVNSRASSGASPENATRFVNARPVPAPPHLLHPPKIEHRLVR